MDSDPRNPYDINGANFSPEIYIQKVFKDASLRQIMEKESEIIRDTQTLHSDMQTLVYENYNKFIAATDTIRKMKSDFKEMEAEMDLLAGNMESIATFSEQISQTLQASAKDMGEAVELLLSLGEPASALCGQFLEHAALRQADQLQALESHLELQDQDIIEFIDMGSSEFLSDLCLVVATYNDMFINKPLASEGLQSEDAKAPLLKFVADAMQRYLSVVQRRIELEQQPGAEATMLVRALDRFYRRLQAVSTLLPGQDFARLGLEVVLNAGQKQADSHLLALKAHFLELLSQVRQSLAVPRMASPSEEAGKAEGTTARHESGLSEMLSSLVAASVDKVKCSLRDLMLFLQPDLTFSLKPNFKPVFCRYSVREGLVVAFIRFITETAMGFCTGPERTPPTLLLLLSKMCLELETSSVHYLISQTDEMFQMDDKARQTPRTELCQDLHATGQKLLDHYVRMQGLNISQMLRKSVETRDWLHTMEPRTVRAVMKRVVEDVAAIDTQVGALYEEGPRQERSSDSSRRTHSVSRHRSNWSSYAPNQLDSSLVTNIQKLFSERIEIFSSAEFSKVSILTGIVKISLKTLLECVRLRTFSKFGLQQIQVDTHYLQLYLWRFVADENLVHFLLDEILGSAVHRCLEPVLMEPSVVEMICERG
ncbi:hypothetical protein B566_EDAN011531 [Ephemera danica]|nr:hypothetical protein B566_EDAN011531 [Ephemera danica]